MFKNYKTRINISRKMLKMRFSGVNILLIYFNQIVNRNIDKDLILLENIADRLISSILFLDFFLVFTVVLYTFSLFPSNITNNNATGSNLESVVGTLLA